MAWHEHGELYVLSLGKRLGKNQNHTKKYNFCHLQAAIPQLPQCSYNREFGIQYRTHSRTTWDLKYTEYCLCRTQERYSKTFNILRPPKQCNLYGKILSLAVLVDQKSLCISSVFTTTNIQYMEIPCCSSISWVLATKFSIRGILWWLRYRNSKIIFFGVVLVFSKTFSWGLYYGFMFLNSLCDKLPFVLTIGFNSIH